MSSERGLDVGLFRVHRDQIHAPRVFFEDGVLALMGRRIPVISAEQLEGRLRQIGCREEMVEEIVGGIFGYPTPVEMWVGAEANRQQD